MFVVKRIYEERERVRRRESEKEREGWKYFSSRNIDQRYLVVETPARPIEGPGLALAKIETHKSNFKRSVLPLMHNCILRFYPSLCLFLCLNQCDQKKIAKCL